MNLFNNGELKRGSPKIAIEMQLSFATVHVIVRSVIPRLSLRGTESRSNLRTGSEQALQSLKRDCFASLAMTSKLRSVFAQNLNF